MFGCCLSADKDIAHVEHVFELKWDRRCGTHIASSQYQCHSQSVHIRMHTERALQR